MSLAARAITSRYILLRALRRILLGDGVLEGILSEQRLVRAFEFCKSWQLLGDVIKTDRADIGQKYNGAKARLREGNKHVSNRLLDVICEGNEVFLANGPMKYSDRKALWTLINEILINEDYYFEADTSSPRILDCGTHFGLAIYYFKSLYPEARITGFEPVPELRQLALENVYRNNYRNVEILPYALSDNEEAKTFILSKDDSMAGSLTDRRRNLGDDLVELTVECRKLSRYLREPVHFLKMDIEGSEGPVLAEAERLLGNVWYLFCEYHHGLGLESDRLGKMLLLLDRAGFDTHVSKSFSHQLGSTRRPMSFVDHPYSAVIWAKNRNWN